MKKKIENLLRGKFKYNYPKLLFSKEKIIMEDKDEKLLEDEIFVGTEDDWRIRGYVMSSDRRLMPDVREFSGTTVCIKLSGDTRGMQPGDVKKGWLCFTTDIGEYKLGFEVRRSKEEMRSASGKALDLQAFTEIAKENFKEAYQLFRGDRFVNVLDPSDQKAMALYTGLSHQPVTYQHVEEYLIALKCKDPVMLSLPKTNAEFYEVSQTAKESFVLRRSGWGHIRIEVDVTGDFLEVTRHVLTDEDFIGSQYPIEYIIRKDRIGKGNCFGEIHIRTPYQELIYSVTASRGSKLQGNLVMREKNHQISLVKDYLDYIWGKLKRDEWLGRSGYELRMLKEEGCDFPEYDMYYAYILNEQENKDEAVTILQKYLGRKPLNEDCESAGLFTYLCVLTGLIRNTEQAYEKIQDLYNQQSDSYVLFRVLQKLDPVKQTSGLTAAYKMEELFEKGCRSPLLYHDAWEALQKDYTPLHRLSRFWVQVFLAAVRNEALTEDAAFRFAYLTSYEKGFSDSTYRVLSYICDQYPTEDNVTAICKYVMKGNPRKPEYFKWFSLAVDMGLRLTRQYEYYIETMDVSYRRELPKSLLLYFSYNSDTLSDAKRAYIYASVIADKGHSLQNYEKYRENMLAFARRTLRDGRMNEDYAILYQEFWRELQDEEEQKSLASCIFANRLFCDDRKIRYVVVRHAQLRKEEIYQCVHGTAYPRIYTDDAVIMFQDEKQRRYVQTVDYNLAKLMDEQPVAEELIRQGQEEAGLLLHYAEHHEISAENLPVFLKTADSETFTEAYRNSIRKRILDYYVQNETGESLEKTLKGMNHRAYAEVDRTEMLTVLIAAGMYPEALEVMKSQGVEGMDDTRLLKTVSRLIQDTEGERDDDLISLASEIHRRGVYNETLLNYLMLWRYAPMDEMLQIWKNAGGFELDTYAFEERILGLLMLCSDYRKDGEMILASYIGHSGKRQTIGAYLTQAAYGIFVKEYAISGFLTEMLLRVYEEEWPVDRVCHLALFKAISKEKDSKGKYTQLKEDLLKECMEDEMLFAFYRKLPQSILSPYQLDDKTFVECHASPAAKVTIRYALDNGFNKDVKYHTEPMQATYEGIFVKTFTLFYGESLRYSFVIEEKDKTRKTSERVITMNKVDGEANSKYHMLNQMLMARHLDKNNEVASRLQKYIHQENFVKEVFTIEGEE